MINDVVKENYTLLHGDCLERMKEIPDGSVDVCVSDIPYGIDFDTWDITHNNSNSALLGQSPKNMESKLFKSRGKPLNGWSQEDKQRTKQFQEWCSTWLGEVFRVLKPCSPILIMCGRQNQHRFTCASEDVGFILKDVITWNKGKAPFRAQKVSNIYEQRGLPLDYEGDWRLGNLSPYCEPIIYMFKPYKVGTTITNQFMENKLGCFDANILTKNIVEVSSLSKNSNHPTEKPVELMETLVKLVSVEGSTVLDMFSGSGSTGVACVNLNRKGIMIEKDPHYFEVGSERVKRALSEKGD